MSIDDQPPEDKLTRATELSEHTSGIPWTPVMEHHPERLGDTDHLVYRTALQLLSGDLAKRAVSAINTALVKAESLEGKGPAFAYSLRGAGKPPASYNDNAKPPYIQIAAGIAERPPAGTSDRLNPLKVIFAYPEVREALQELKPLTGKYTDPELEARLKLLPEQKQPYAKKLEAEYRRITPGVGPYGAMPPTITQAIQLASDLHGTPDQESEKRLRYSGNQRNRAFQIRLAAAYKEAGLDVGDREIAKVLERAAAMHVQFFSGAAMVGSA